MSENVLILDFRSIIIEKYFTKYIIKRSSFNIRAKIDKFKYLIDETKNYFMYESYQTTLILLALKAQLKINRLHLF